MTTIIITITVILTLFALFRTALILASAMRNRKAIGTSSLPTPPNPSTGYVKHKPMASSTSRPRHYHNQMVALSSDSYDDYSSSSSSSFSASSSCDSGSSSSDSGGSCSVD